MNTSAMRLLQKPELTANSPIRYAAQTNFLEIDAAAICRTPHETEAHFRAFYWNPFCFIQVTASLFFIQKKRAGVATRP
jgi:hypothetical protein